MTRVLALLLALLPATALAHDSWINKGAYRNPAGEWCCGDGDCAVMDDDAVNEVRGGMMFSGIGRIAPGTAGELVEHYDEMIPHSEIMPLSRDGRFWRCKKPDGSRRCVFGPPPPS